MAAASSGGSIRADRLLDRRWENGQLPELCRRHRSPVAWSHDSRYLAIVSEPSNPPADPFAEPGARLQVIDTLTGAIFTLAEGQIFGASFAPDSSDRLAFGLASSAAPSAPVNLYIANPNGTPNVSVAKPPPNEEFVPLPGGGSAVRFTSDGRSLNPVWGSALHRLRPRAPATETSPRAMTSGWACPPIPGSRAASRTCPPASSSSGLVPLAFSAAGERLLPSSRAKTRAKPGRYACPPVALAGSPSAARPCREPASRP